MLFFYNECMLRVQVLAGKLLRSMTGTAQVMERR